MRAFLQACEPLHGSRTFGRVISHVPAPSPTSQGHGLSRVAVQHAAGKGETLGEDASLAHLKGEPDTLTSPAPEVESAPEVEPASKGEKKPKVQKTELAAPTAGDCGAYSWQVRFSLKNGTDKTTGYIVQKVNAVYKRKDCLGESKPVTGIGTFPFWEAWGVRAGKVFIGDTASEHNADTYSDASMGDSTKGSIAVTAKAEFFPDVTLPEHMKADNPDTQAGSLRSSLTDPALKGGTGSIPHNLTASWNCCGKSDKKTVFSNKK